MKFILSDEVQVEDIAICEAVQRGLASGSYVAGRLNPKRESGVQHFHDLLRRAYRAALVPKDASDDAPNDARFDAPHHAACDEPGA